MIDNFTDTELKNEVWRDIDGYDGVYQVSDLGRVRSRKSGEWKVLKAYKDKDGYSIVCMYRDGNRKPFLVHRLVASALIPNDNILNSEINHINEVKTDNRVSNLEWCDRQYNNTYNDLYWRRKGSVRRKVKELYRPELPINENLEIFRANGVECSGATVIRLRKDLGLSKPRKYTKRS